VERQHQSSDGSWINFMDEAAWKGLVDYYERVSKGIDPRKAERVFQQNVEAVVDAIPKPDRELLRSYWRGAKEATHPFVGTKHPAPLFLVASNFAVPPMTERATGMMTSGGCCFVFEGRLVHTAPGEVVQSVIAHELAHGLIYAKYHSQKLSLPAPTFPSNEKEQERQFEAYPQAKRHEESLVGEILTKWGFVQYLLEYWEIAIEDAPHDPHSLYSTLKRLAKENPVVMGISPARTA
jgi:hypothetical protein